MPSYLKKVSMQIQFCKPEENIVCLSHSCCLILWKLVVLCVADDDCDHVRLRPQSMMSDWETKLANGGHVEVELGTQFVELTADVISHTAFGTSYTSKGRRWSWLRGICRSRRGRGPASAKISPWSRPRPWSP
jgi:hypothetical protein